MFKNHKFVVTKFLLVGCLEVSARSGKAIVSPLLNIVDEHLFHVVSAYTHTVLLIGLTAILSESVSQVVMERRWQFSCFVFMRIIFESLGRVEEWSTISSVLLLTEQVIGIVSDLLIKGLVIGETFTLGEGEHLL